MSAGPGVSTLLARAARVGRPALALLIVAAVGYAVVAQWPEVARAMRGDLVVDGRNALDPEAVRGAGLKYDGVGRR